MYLHSEKLEAPMTDLNCPYIVQFGALTCKKKEATTSPSP